VCILEGDRRERSYIYIHACIQYLCIHPKPRTAHTYTQHNPAMRTSGPFYSTYIQTYCTYRHTYILTYIHAHTSEKHNTQTYTHNHTYIHSDSLSHTHPQSHIHTLSLSLTHNHTQSHTGELRFPAPREVVELNKSKTSFRGAVIAVLAANRLERWRRQSAFYGRTLTVCMYVLYVGFLDVCTVIQ